MNAIHRLALSVSLALPLLAHAGEVEVLHWWTSGGEKRAADTLQKIADETGGTSYIAETPDDIERVFVQALLARRG